jgi:hypothetical protein
VRPPVSNNTFAATRSGIYIRPTIHTGRETQKNPNGLVEYESREKNGHERERISRISEIVGGGSGRFDFPGQPFEKLLPSSTHANGQYTLKMKLPTTSKTDV